MFNNLLLQGITHHTHETAVSELLALPHAERITVAVAFLNTYGLIPLSHALAPVATRTTFFVGIRNGITTAQGLTELLRLHCSVYVVDPGSRSILFHPKIYLSRSTGEARLIVGSANVTHGGLNSNIEASLCLSWDLGDPANAKTVADLETQLYSMPVAHPENVLSITDVSAVQRLLDSGRVVDEDIPPAPTPSDASRDPHLDTPTTMSLLTKRTPLTVRHPPTPRERLSNHTPSPTSIRPQLVWQSKPLTRRDLTIPQAKTTNPTGSMLFTKGMMDSIDQRHYFRDDVFSHIDWHTDTGKPHYERATAQFQLIIAGVDCGQFNLRISHDARTDSPTYRQNNSVTQLHWGDARSLVARPHLLGRTMYLFENEYQFVIEID